MVESSEGSKTLVLFEKLGYDRSLEGDNGRSDNDKLNWKFLLMVLREMGFGNKWIGWIHWCLSTASFSVIINGNSIGFFKSSRGLRQGDLLSPYLFVLGMKVFSLLLTR